MSQMTKPRWGFRTNPVRTTVAVVLAFVLALLFGTFVQAKWIQADAVECVAVGGPDDCETVTEHQKTVAKKIRDKVIPNTKDGFDMRRVFSEPKKVREVLVQRIQTAMIASQGSPGADTVMCCTESAAASAYVTMVNYPVCGGTHRNASNLIDAYNSDFMCRLDNLPPPDQPGDYINAEEAKKVATVMFCGTSMALAIGLSGASAGATAAVGISAAGGCLMSVWD